MNLTINGDPHISNAAHVEDLLCEFDLPLAAVLVEHNGIALLRSEWTNTTLRDNDRLEIVRMVAGG